MYYWELKFPTTLTQHSKKGQILSDFSKAFPNTIPVKISKSKNSDELKKKLVP